MSDFLRIFNRSTDEDDANLYAKAEEEIESGLIDRGMWSQALVLADGNEQRRKAEYMKLRVSKLKRQSQKTSTIIKSFSHSSPEIEKVEALNRETESEKNYKGIGRTAFILSSIGSIFLIGFVTSLATGSGVNSSPIGLILSTLALFIFSWFRMKNIGKSPWLSLLVIVPFGNILLIGWGAILPEGYKESRELDLAGKIVGAILLAGAIILLLAMFL